MSQTPLTLNESLYQPLTCDPLYSLQQANQTLFNHFGALQSSIFQCDALPACAVTCVGPPVDVLSALSKDCSCMAEWWWNGYLMQTLLSLFIYIVLNVSR